MPIGWVSANYCEKQIRQKRGGRSSCLMNGNEYEIRESTIDLEYIKVEFTFEQSIQINSSIQTSIL